MNIKKNLKFIPIALYNFARYFSSIVKNIKTNITAVVKTISIVRHYFFSAVKNIITNIIIIIETMGVIKHKLFSAFVWFILLMLPPRYISVITTEFNNFYAHIYKTELKQKAELIKYISLFCKNFTFINNFMLLNIILFNIYLIKTSNMYKHYYQLK